MTDMPKLRDPFAGFKFGADIATMSGIDIRDVLFVLWADLNARGIYFEANPHTSASMQRVAMRLKEIAHDRTIDWSWNAKK